VCRTSGAGFGFAAGSCRNRLAMPMLAASSSSPHGPAMPADTPMHHSAARTAIRWLLELGLKAKRAS